MRLYGGVLTCLWLVAIYLVLVFSLCMNFCGFVLTAVSTSVSLDEY